METDHRDEARGGGGLREFLEGRWAAWALGSLLMLAGVLAAVVLYTHDRYSFLYFGDAASHIVKSREFTDSHRIWFHYLGTIWLPFPHLLLAPLTYFDALFFSGIAAPMIGIPCLAGTGVLLYLMIRDISGSQEIGLLSSLLFALNPNVVYICLTPMNEPSLIFFVTLGGFGLHRWLQKDSMKWLLLSASAVLLATLCRYEAWLLAPFITLVAAWREARRWREERSRAMFRVLLVAGVSSAGMLFWFWWNAKRYGNPLAFVRGTYGIIPDTFRESQQRMPAFIVYTLARAIVIVFGPMFVYVAATGIATFRATWEKRNDFLVLLYFLLPAGFVFASVMAGYIGVDEWWWNWRYVLTLGLLLAVAGGIGLAAIFRSWPPATRWVMVAGLLAMPMIQMLVPAVGVAVYKDAAKCVLGPTPSAIAVGEQLQKTVMRGSVGLLTGHGQAQRIMVSSWLPLRRFDIFPQPTDAEWKVLSSEQFLVIGTDKTPESGQAFQYWLTHKGLILQRFEVCRADDFFIVLRRRQDGGKETETPASPLGRTAQNLQ